MVIYNDDIETYSDDERFLDIVKCLFINGDLI